MNQFFFSGSPINKNRGEADYRKEQSGSETNRANGSTSSFIFILDGNP
jgi:hypothetical protein